MKRVDKAQEERAVKAQGEPEVVDRDNGDKAPSNALEGLRRQARSRVRGRITGSRRVGASRCRGQRV